MMPTNQQYAAALQAAKAAGDQEAVDFIQAEMARQSAASSEGPVSLKSPPINTAAMAVGETALNLGSGALTMPLAGLAGLGNIATNAMGITDSNPADTVNWVAGKTYQPRTEAGQGLTNIVTYPFAKLAEGADWAGGKVADVTGSPALGAATNTAIQSIPMLVAPVVKGVKSARSASPAGTAPPAGGAATSQGAGHAWTARNTALDWTSLPEAFKQSLTSIAENATVPNAQTAATIERAGRLASLDIPATRGQLTRDTVQLRNENNVAHTNAGIPIRNIHIAQNKALVENLKTLKNEQGGSAASDSQVGVAVQDAARAKLEWRKKRVKKLYDSAMKSPETLQLVDSTPLFDFISQQHNPVFAELTKAWINFNKLAPGKGVTIRAVESLVQDLNAKIQAGGDHAWHAGQIKGVLDQMTAGEGGNLYKAARAERKKMAIEFEDQQGVLRLVKDKTRTDRAVALEDTFNRTVANGKIEELAAVRKSLLEGGSTKTRTAGQRAWIELRAQTIQHILDRATRSVSPWDDGTPNITADALKKGIDDIGKEKLDILFGPTVYARLQNILQATMDIKTEPPTSFKGSSTAANALAFLEDLVSTVPVARNLTAGAVEVVTKLRNLGAPGRVVRSATSSPVDDLARQSRNAMLRKRTAPNALSAAATTVGDRSTKQ